MAVRGPVMHGSQTLLIVDDDPRIRGFIMDLVRGESGIRVLGEAGNGEDAVRLARELRPAVVLMDLAMPRMGGLEALRRTKRELPATKVIVVTVHGEDAYRRAAFACGADAFIVKKRLRGELLSTLRRVDEGAPGRHQGVRAEEPGGGRSRPGDPRGVLREDLPEHRDIPGRRGGVPVEDGAAGGPVDDPGARGSPACRRGEDDEGNRPGSR